MAAAVKRLVDKVAVITGGASGIGAATAKLFAANGAKVVIVDIQDEKGEELARSLGPNAEYVHADVAREADISAAVDSAVSSYGRLDVMFNNAGVTGLLLDRFHELNTKDLDSVYAINIRGVALGVKHAARAMVGGGRRGCILCTASICSLAGSGILSSYTISKHAVVGIVQAAASDLGAHGIRVNCISPNVIATPLVMATQPPGTSRMAVEAVLQQNAVLKGMLLQPLDIANAALFLASDEGRYISGQNLVVDGGYSATYTGLQKMFTSQV